MITVQRCLKLLTLSTICSCAALIADEEFQEIPIQKEITDESVFLLSEQSKFEEETIVNSSREPFQDSIASPQMHPQNKSDDHEKVLDNLEDLIMLLESHEKEHSQRSGNPQQEELPASSPEPKKPGQILEDKMAKTSVEPGAILFTAPEGWVMAEPSMLPPRVKVMVIGKGVSEYPPSINLGMEPYSGSVKDYLKIVKAINESQNAEWKDLGQIRTQAGNASLSQVDMETEWGNVRLMHVILKKGDNLYVLTAAAKKDEFPQFYADFFKSMRSLRFNKEAMEMVTDPKRKSRLQQATRKVKSEWEKLLTEAQESNPQATNDALKKQLFQNESFRSEFWNPIQAILKEEFADMGDTWRRHLLQKLENELLSNSNEKKK